MGVDRAVELSDPADPGRDALLVERAEILMWAGRIPEAEATCRSLLDRAHDPTVEASARICLGRCLAAAGRQDALREFSVCMDLGNATMLSMVAADSVDTP